MFCNLGIFLTLNLVILLKKKSQMRRIWKSKVSGDTEESIAFVRDTLGLTILTVHHIVIPSSLSSHVVPRSIVMNHKQSPPLGCFRLAQLFSRPQKGCRNLDC